MRIATKCIVLMALADLASGFSFALTYTGVDRSVVSKASQSRALPRTVVRAAPLRLGGLHMTATKIPITITGTNIEVLIPTTARRKIRFKKTRIGIHASDCADTGGRFSKTQDYKRAHAHARVRCRMHQHMEHACIICGVCHAFGLYHSPFIRPSSFVVPICLTDPHDLSLHSIGLEQLTQPLKDYVNEKIGSALSKVGRKVIRCDVTLTINKNPSIELSQSIEVQILCMCRLRSILVLKVSLFIFQKSNSATLCVCVCVCVHACVYVCVCMCVYICVWERLRERARVEFFLLPHILLDCHRGQGRDAAQQGDDARHVRLDWCRIWFRCDTLGLGVSK